MKPLLHKTTRPFLMYVLTVLAVSVPLYYLVVDAIWRAELDEHNTIIADKTTAGLNKLHLPESELKTSIKLWNSIQPGTDIREPAPGDNLKDSIFTIERERTYGQAGSIDRFRCLSRIIHVNGRPYRLSVQTNIEETGETIAVIAAITLFLFLLIVVGLFWLTRRLSYTIWKPFYDTLNKLKAFNLNKHTAIAFEQTDTKEFKELNQSLSKLVGHSVSVYQSQKEFTENASHELQTPLAIVKSKIDLLLQSDNLTEEQYRISEDMNRALIRSARISKNLLLLSKLDNNQFNRSEIIQLNGLLLQSIENLQVHFRQKNLTLDIDIAQSLQAQGNSSLTEVLISNLLHNAVRHTTAGGCIRIRITPPGLSIANSGKQALDPAMLFRRFAKLSSESSGSGLGLSIVREICRFQDWQVVYKFEQGFHTFIVNT